MRKLGCVCILVYSVLLAGCQMLQISDKNMEQSRSGITETVQEMEKSMTEEKVKQMTVTAGDGRFSADLESNEAVEELVEMMKKEAVTIFMSDYSGFEKVGSLDRNLTASNHQMTTSSGDIVLYNGSQIVIFYGSNSWSYTKLGRITDLSGWEEALGKGDVTVTFSIE